MAAQQDITTTPERIVDLAIGYMRAKQLFAASRIGLFRAVAGGNGTAAEIAGATGIGERSARILADTMNSAGLLERTTAGYTLSPDATDYLTGDGSLEAFLTFLNEISYGHWAQFDNTIDTGIPGDPGLNGDRMPTFMAGVMRYNGLHAAMLARTFDFTSYRSMLDLGGLSPEFSINAMLANPELRTTFAFAPDFTGAVTEALQRSGLLERTTVDPAPTETAAPGGDHDIVMLNHVIHRFDADTNRTILGNARAAARTGATLLLLDFFLDDDARQRPIDAAHAGEYFVIDGTVVYPITEVREWLLAAGWRPREVLSLPGSPRVLVADAR